MTATYNTVSIGGSDFEVYADISTADAYLEAEVSDAAAKWRDDARTDEDAKARALVTATRLLDRQQWAGTKTDPDYQELAWPRTGTGIAGVDDDAVPQAIIDAACLLAAEINNGSNVTATASTASGIKREKAGSVELEFFGNFSDTGAPRFPTAVEELLRGLRGTAGLGGAAAYGTDECSRFRIGYEPTTP